MEAIKEMLHDVLQEAPEKRSLVSKLCAVMGTLKRIPKSGFNSFLNYAYVTESDLADAVRDELAKQKVFVFPSIIEIHRTPHDVETMKGIRKTQLTEIMVRWTFEDGESGEVRVVNIPGVGEDNNDKGFYKAFTGSEKYMLMKSFLIATGDDPERESNTDRYDAKEKQQKVVDEKLKNKKRATPPPDAPRDDILWLSELEDGMVKLEGWGLQLLRSEIDADTARALEIKKRKGPDGDVIVIPQAKVFDGLAQVCDRAKIKMHWRDKKNETVTTEI